jgi:hypothetical protein
MVLDNAENISAKDILQNFIYKAVKSKAIIFLPSEGNPSDGYSAAHALATRFCRHPYRLKEESFRWCGCSATYDIF